MCTSLLYTALDAIIEGIESRERLSTTKRRGLAKNFWRRYVIDSVYRSRDRQKTMCKDVI